MRLTHLHIQNFRAFESVSLTDLHPAVNVVVGVNGTGKTALLEAARLFLSGIYSELDKHVNKIVMSAILEDDVRLANLEVQYPTCIRGEVFLDAHLLPEGKAVWERLLERHGGKTKFGESRGKAAKALSRNIQSIIRQGVEQAVPLVAYYSTDRYKKEKKNTGLEADGSRLRGYYNALDSQTNTWFFLNLIRTETLAELQEGRPSEILRLVYEAIQSCIPGCISLKHHLKKDCLIITFSDGRQLPFNALSDGVRHVLSLVMELALRAYLLNPYLGVEAARNTPGVVLIDEIDLHLHPEWQLHIVQDLVNVFPKLQFIVTTHAPLVLNSLKEGRIYSISDNQVYDFPRQYTRPTDDILRDMQVNLALDEAINRYRLLIENGQGRSPEALALRQMLEERLGANHEELRMADIMLQLFDAAQS